MPMPVPRPVRPGLVATPSCFFFFLKECGGLTTPFAHAHAHANARLGWWPPPPVRSFFFLRKECDGLTILFAHTHANACAF